MNLSIPNINISDGSNKEIVDVLHRYRKELNFLLMNLDESNMPAIANRLDGIDGSFSLINQDLESITLAVGNAQGDISALELRAGSIELSVSNLDGDLSSLSLTVDGISSTVSSHTGSISTLTQTATSLQTQITNNDGDISTINQTISSIQSTVSSHTTTIGTHTSQITQLDNEISSVVSWTDVTGDAVVSKITQTATNISLLAAEIDLEGITRILSGNSEVKFDRYGDFTIKFGSYYPFTIENTIPGVAFYSTYGKYMATDGGDTWAYGYWDFANLPSVGSDDIVTANDEVYINTTAYGIDITAPGRTAITIKWGANLI